MKKITITFLLSFVSLCIYAQNVSLLVGATGPTGYTSATYIAQEDITGNIGIGIPLPFPSGTTGCTGPTGCSGPSGYTGYTGIGVVLGVGNVSNSNITDNNGVFAAANVTNTCGSSLAAGNAGFTMLALRLDPACFNNSQIDFCVDGLGHSGIGTFAGNFNNVFTSSAYSGTLLGVTDPNPSGTTPLFTVATNTNNPTTFNLAAVTVDYRGYTSLGEYFTDAVPNLAHLFLTDPNPSGTDALLGVFTNANNPTGSVQPGLQVDYKGYTSIGAFYLGAGPAHLYLTDPNPSGTDPLLDVVTNASAQSLYIASSGKVGIGTASPAYPLDVSGSVNVSTNLYVGSTVQIGTTKPVTSAYDTFALSVAGNIVAKKVKVETSDWADFVFDKGYKLTALSDIEKYIAQNKHLPDVPSECDAIEKGLDVGEMNKLLLQKVEELTLYLIQQKKEIDALKNK